MSPAGPPNPHPATAKPLDTSFDHLANPRGPKTKGVPFASRILQAGAELLTRGNMKESSRSSSRSGVLALSVLLFCLTPVCAKVDEPGRPIGKASVKGDLIVMELDDGALGKTNLFNLTARTLRFTPEGSRKTPKKKTRPRVSLLPRLDLTAPPDPENRQTPNYEVT